MPPLPYPGPAFSPLFEKQTIRGPGSSQNSVLKNSGKAESHDSPCRRQSIRCIDFVEYWRSQIDTKRGHGIPDLDVGHDENDEK